MTEPLGPDAPAIRVVRTRDGSLRVAAGPNRVFLARLEIDATANELVLRLPMAQVDLVTWEAVEEERRGRRDADRVISRPSSGAHRAARGGR
jgi:hypothetical protein